MNTELEKKSKDFEILNDITLKNEIVIFGSTYMANFPVYELASKCKLEQAVYNRSVEKMTLDDASKILKVAVLDIRPKKVFLSLGEEDVYDKTAVEKYRKIVKKIRVELPETKIYLLGVENLEFSKEIEKFADGKTVEYVALDTLSGGSVASYKKTFSRLCRFFRNAPMSFLDAVSYSL